MRKREGFVIEAGQQNRMRWEDEGIFLAGRPYGETAVIADIFTRNHGRSLGLIKGGRSRRLRPLLQTGNKLNVEWRARLEEQLGVYTAELAAAVTVRALDDAIALSALSSMGALLQVLPERDPHQKLYDAASACFDRTGERDFLQHLVKFEVTLLEELGFGLTLDVCASTGRTGNLAYVSPRSAQAVCGEAGEPFRDKLLTLPRFLAPQGGAEPTSPDFKDINDGLVLTGYFLEQHLGALTGSALPNARISLKRLIQLRI